MKRIFVLCALLAVAGCATSQTGQVAELKGAYITGVSAEIAYEAVPGSSTAILATVEADRIKAYTALQPLVAAAECTSAATAPCTSVYTVAEYEVAAAAVAALQNYETANNVKGS